MTDHLAAALKIACSPASVRNYNGNLCSAKAALMSYCNVCRRTSGTEFGRYEHVLYLSHRRVGSADEPEQFGLERKHRLEGDPNIAIVKEGSGV